ncbi:MAG: hypothetical protein K6E51_01425 [Treponema sp.]|nr:hypothetical protein [Treponema sp.]
MKSVLGLIFTYFFVCLVGTTAGALCYMLYKGCLLFVVGTPMNILSLSMFIQGIQLVLPIILLSSPLFLTLYRIRHSQNQTHLLITYIILVVLSWTVIFRLGICFLRSYSPRSYITVSLPSTGYFRSDKETVTYYSSYSQERPVTLSGIQVKLVGIQQYVNSVTPFEGEQVPQNDDKEFKESLIEPFLKMPVTLARVLMVFSVLCNTAYITYGEGLLQWCFFISIGLALSSVYGLVRMSSWKLLNAFFVIAVSSVICIINSMYYLSTRFSDGALRINAWLDSFIRVQVPSVVLINVCIGIICIALGVIFSLIQRNPE